MKQAHEKQVPFARPGDEEDATPCALCELVMQVAQPGLLSSAARLSRLEYKGVVPCEKQSLTWRYTWLVLRGSGARRRASSRFLNTSVLSLSYPDSFKALRKGEERLVNCD
ncbi:hypothetical protein E2C01_087884 [Portunus trituberculatus]|uniref:Uncharacterized protein n=1 Tax=Portunus trituberculatus TaxID=210409 RepID=A0A5B7JIF8_PORTR|nr:hypothetical protein [Portunus trituberculatus]